MLSGILFLNRKSTFFLTRNFLPKNDLCISKKCFDNTALSLIAKKRKTFKKAYRFKREITENRSLFPLRNGGETAVFFALSARFAVDVVRRSGYVVDRNVVQPRKLYNALERYRAAVVFVLRVVALSGVEIFGDLALGH